MIVSEALKAVTAGEVLTDDQAEDLLADLVEGTPSCLQVAALLGGLRARGETIDEITGFARGMRARVIPVKTSSYPLVDTCGTGGDTPRGGTGTFNISTAAAIIAAAAGVKIAKHGNRAVSSRSGSADVLEALGVNLNLSPEQVARCIDEVGIGFMFAPNHHPAMKNVGPIRKELGVRTIFNLLGPLTNPAGATRQVMGVPAVKWMHPLAATLRSLGCEKALVVHSEDGLDEFSTCAPTDYVELSHGELRGGRFHPETEGILCEDPALLAGGDASANAALVESLLRSDSGPRVDIVCLNAAAAMMVADVAEDFAAGIRLARATLASGAALEKLGQLRSFTQQHSS